MRKNYRLLLTICAIIICAGLVSCHKNHDSTPPASAVLPFNFQLSVGSNATPVTIDSVNKIVRNLPRTVSNVKQITANAILPSGYTISPNPSTISDYSSPVKFTITGQGNNYNVTITALPYDSATNPYGVYTAADLNDMRNGLNNAYALMNDIKLPDMNSAGNTATGISDYASYGWYSIGSKYVNGGSVIFRGSLDGRNHTISNLAIAYREATNSQPTGIDVGHQYKSNDGLFGYAATATFKNINIQLAPAGINVQAADGSGEQEVAPLVGRADTCTFSNCKVTGNATIICPLYGAGLVGNASNCTISKCSASIAHTTATNFAINAGEVGGLVGRAFGSTITDSYAACDITGNADIGGLIGALNSTNVQRCYATGNVTEQTLTGAIAQVGSNSLGGLIGTVVTYSPNSVVIKNCYATGSVAGANGNQAFHQNSKIGGLVGQVSSTGTGATTVSYCFASGAVSRVWANSATPYLIGSLVGSTTNNIFVNGGTSSTNYWDKTTTTQTYLGGGNTTIAQDNAFTTNGKTTSEMKTQATYSGWDFTATWAIDQSKNNGYPYLR